MALDFSSGGVLEDSAKGGALDFSKYGSLDPSETGDNADRSWLDFGKDIGKSVVKGTVSLAGDVGWMVRKGVVDPIGRAVEGEANYVPNTDFEKATTGTTEMIGESESSKLRGQHQQVGKIMDQGGWDGFTAAAGYVLSNPSMIPMLAAESAAPTASIGAAGAQVLKAVGTRIMLAKGAETAIAGWSTGAAEGIQTLGNIGRQIEQKLDEKGITDPETRSLAMQQAIPAALVTMVAGRFGGGTEAKFFTDVARNIESTTAKSALKSVAHGMGKEGLEEVEQSAGEQFFQNLGEGSAGLETDLSRGVGANAAIGGITGAAQGGGATAYRETINGIIDSRRPVSEPPRAILDATSVDEAIAASEAALDTSFTKVPSETERAAERHHNVDFEATPTPEVTPSEPFAVDGIPFDRPAALGILDAARGAPRTRYDPEVADAQLEAAPIEPPAIAIPGEPAPQSIPPSSTTQQEYANALEKQSRGELLSSYERVLLNNPPTTPAIEVVEGTKSVRGKDPATLTMRELELAARLTRSDERRAQISAEIERRAVPNSSTNVPNLSTEAPNAVQVGSPEAVDVRQQAGNGEAVGEGNPEERQATGANRQSPTQEVEASNARAVEVPVTTAGGANVQTAANVSEGTAQPGTVQEEAGSRGAAEAPVREVNGPSVQAAPAPAAATSETGVESQGTATTPGQGTAVPEVTSESGNQGIQFRDYTAPKTVGEGARAIIKGSVRTFKTERAASVFAKAQGLPKTWSPRDTGEGWVLSKPAADPVIEAQRAAARRASRIAVRPTDSAFTLVEKAGGWNRADAMRDGVDIKDIKARPFTFRTNEGLSIDGIAEVLDANGFDVRDENGHIDATKAREIMQESLGGPVYSQQGMELRAAKDAEARARYEAKHGTQEQQETGYAEAAPEVKAAVARVEDDTFLPDPVESEALDEISDEELAKWRAEGESEASGDSARPNAEATRAGSENRAADESPKPPQGDALEHKFSRTQTPSKEGVSTSEALKSIPPGLLKKITVEVQQAHDGEGVKTAKVSADQALADIDSEIAAYEKLLLCVRA
jgi:hypothetical protein